jgi:hypothetical protein
VNNIIIINTNRLIVISFRNTMIHTKTTSTTTRTSVTSPPSTTTTTTLDGTTSNTSSKLYKIIKHTTIGALSLSLSRIALYAPFSTQKTLIAISDTPQREDEEAATQGTTMKSRLGQYFDQSLLTKLALYQLGHIAATSFLSKQTLVPLSTYKPLEHAIVSASTFPLYYIMIDQESRLALKRGRTSEALKVEEGDNSLYWQGFALHVLHSFLVHAASLKVSQLLLNDDKLNLNNVSDEAVTNHDSSDGRAQGVLVETASMLVGRLLCLPIEIYSKQLLLRSKPKTDSYVSVFVKSALLTVPQVTTTFIEYWIYRMLNRAIQ